MSFLFGGGRPQPSSAEKIAAAEQEVDLVSDMYKRSGKNILESPIHKGGCLKDPLANSCFFRLTKSCLQKCVPADYREAELNKGESVCLDRCVAKFFEVNIKVSEKMQGEAAARGGGGGGGAGGIFGM